MFRNKRKMLPLHIFYTFFQLHAGAVLVGPSKFVLLIINIWLALQAPHQHVNQNWVECM